MANLAIRGHAKRGKEVIELLEMLGGENKAQLKGIDTTLVYYICSEGYSEGHIGTLFAASDKHYKVFTLEEFLEEFPYRVGDKVIFDGSNATIVSMEWDGIDVIYTVNRNDELWNTIAFNLQPYKEVPIYLNEKANKQAEEIAEILEPAKEIMEKQKKYHDEWFQTDYLEFENNDDTWADEVEVNLGKDYEIQIRGDKTFIVKKKSQYPKTYEECCEVLPLGEDGRLYTKGYKASLIQEFQQLLICRDAYWKIAGEQMGLGKSWEPDWKKHDKKYIISVFKDTIIYFENETYDSNTILAFPTPEMRDTFYENFKDLIEQCKELL